MVPPTSSTTRPASGSARSSSWDAKSTVAPAAAAPRDELVDAIAPLRIEPGVGLVEQPQLGTAGHQTGQRRAPALTGGELAHGHVGEAAGQPAGGEGGVDVRRGRAGGPPPEPDVVAHGEVVVEAGGVAQEAHPAPDLAGPAAVGEVRSEHPSLAPHDGEQAGAGAQQRGLPGPVRPAEEHDLSGGDIEVDPGEGREPAKQGHRAAEVDDGLHGTGQGY